MGMENVLMMNCGDGYRRAGRGATGPITGKAASYTIKPQDVVAGRVFSNTGAGAAVTFTLPTPKAQMEIPFFKAVPAQNLVIQATAAAKINGGTAGKAYQNVTSETGTCVLFSDGVDWYVKAEKGTWANNNT